MGQETFGKYQLIAALGHGGMADVFLAVQAGPVGSGFKKLCVVKRLRTNLADEPEFVAMLIDEARIAARLNHPNVVQTNEVGECNGNYFIAMEYLDGQPLHRIQHRATQRTRAGEALSLRRAHQYVALMETLAGLHHAHELCDYDGTPLNIVHRDVTPHNIFVTYEGQTKVVDFGIAKAAGRMSETRHGTVKGKVRYMAPEQAMGLPVDRRADVFSVGVMVWEVATGRRLWKDIDDSGVVHALLSDDYPRSPRAVDPSVPEALDAICVKALAHRADDRYSTADEMRADLERFLDATGELLDARRKVGHVIAELFQDKRDEIRSIIEQQLAAVDAPVSVSPLRGPAFDTPPSSSFSLPPPSSARGIEQHTLSAQKTMVYERPGPRPRWKAVFATASVLLAIAAIAAVARSTLRGAPPTTTANTKPASVEEIALEIAGSPAHARVSIDQGPFVALPHRVRLPRDDRQHQLRLEADGFEPSERTIAFAHDLTLTFELVKVAEKPVVATASGASSVRKGPERPSTAPAVRPRGTRPRSGGGHSAAGHDTAPVATGAPAPTPPTPVATPSSKTPKPAIDNGDPWANR